MTIARKDRQAILIMAHNNISEVKQLIKYFHEGCDIYIHIDKKHKLSTKNLNELLLMKGVRMVVQKYKTNWGSYNILKAELYLLSLSYKEQRASYFHLLSAQDYPLCPLWYFLDFFKSCNQNFIDCKLANFWHIHERILQFHPYALLDAKKTKKRVFDFIINLQRKLGLFRSTRNLPRYITVGSQWFSITDDCVQRILSPTPQDKRFLKRLKYTFAPEEIYINTIIVNNIKNALICNDNLRFIRWKYENGNCPANLDIHHLKYCLFKRKLFARKFDPKYSSDLKHVINDGLIQNTQFNLQKDYNKSLYDMYFCCDLSIAKSIKYISDALRLNSILYVGCGSCLLLDKLIALKVPTLGIDTSIHSWNFAKSYNLTDYFQKVDSYEELKTSGCFDLVLLINDKVNGNIYKNSKAIDCLCKLAGRGFFVVEEQNCQIESDDLSSLSNQLVFNGFIIDDEISNLLSCQNSTVKYLYFKKNIV